jgi:hypothetical protein
VDVLSASEAPYAASSFHGAPASTSGPPAAPRGPLVTAAPVLSVPPVTGSSGALVLLAVTRAEAATLAGATHLTLSLSPPAPATIRPSTNPPLP